MSAIQIGQHEREAVKRRIERLQAELQALEGTRLPRAQLADKWQSLLDQIADLREKLGDG